MKKFLRYDEMDLQLFAEGAGGADGGTTGSDAAGVTAADAGQQDTGVNAGAAQAGTVDTADAGQEQKDLSADFDGLIRGKYKDQFNASVKKILDGRLSSVNKKLQGYESGQAVFDILAQKYGIDPTDYAAIAEAAQKDKSFYEQEAIETGKAVEDVMELKRVQRENATMRRQMEQQRQFQEDQQRQQQANEQEKVWLNQAKEAQKVFPGLNLETEIKNPDFARLLRSGVPVKAAYQVVHMDDIMGGAMQYAAQRAAKNVTDNVIAGTARPAENGTAAQGAVSAKVDPSKFTPDDIKKYRERAARGERITF